jgi:hypothetical protein
MSGETLLSMWPQPDSAGILPPDLIFVALSHDAPGDLPEQPLMDF